MSTLLCVPILVIDVESALADAHTARSRGADLVEFRIDEWFSGGTRDTPVEDEAAAVARLVSRSPLPCIVTCRSSTHGEGGHYRGDDQSRIALIERLVNASGPHELPPRYIDLEFSALSRAPALRDRARQALRTASKPGAPEAGLILSLHDFKERPPDLSRRLLAMRADTDARVLKIAYRMRSLRDNLELFDLLAERDRPTITVGLGEFGLLSRVLGPKFGAFATFGSLRPGSATAPGQPTLSELLDLYRIRSIGPRTAVYGLIGWPVDHSLSPHVHNAGFEACECDAVYLPLPVVGDANSEDATYASLKATLPDLIEHPRLDFRGCSVTIPFKRALVRLAREMGWTQEEFALGCGAANTVVVDRCLGRTDVYICNTDADAATPGLSDALGGLADARVGLLGSGGVARSLAFGLARAGAHITIFSRSPARCAGTCKELELALPPASGTISPAPRDVLNELACDAYVNCTPLGMRTGPEPHASALPDEVLAEGAASPTPPVIMDTVYAPLVTPLLARARQLGLRTIDGLDMFVRQAAAQFEHWTGKPAPRALFDRVAREAATSAPPGHTT